MNQGQEGNVGQVGKGGRGPRSDHQVSGVKRILVSDDMLDVLGKAQVTSQPKMDMRYWVEGVISVISENPELMDAVTRAARQRLRKALDEIST